MTMQPIVIDNESGNIIVELRDGDVIVAQSDVDDTVCVSPPSFLEWYQAHHEPDECGIL